MARRETVHGGFESGKTGARAKEGIASKGVLASAHGGIGEGRKAQGRWPMGVLLVGLTVTRAPQRRGGHGG